MVEEPLTSGRLVKLSSLFVAQRHVNHVEVAVFGVFEPLAELGSLDALHGPVPGILRLDDVEAIVKAHSHGSVA